MISPGTRESADVDCIQPFVVEHGGVDSGPPIDHDFSTNANSIGPPPHVIAAVQLADRRRYPDPSYEALRRELAYWHGTIPRCIEPTAGTSEAIRRFTLAAHMQGISQVWVPQPGYGDYRAAALALGLHVQSYVSGHMLLEALDAAKIPALIWLCEPNNPTGQSLSRDFWQDLGGLASKRDLVVCIDRAYEPLRLHGADPVPSDVASGAWQFFSPNKSLGMTGVRAGYLLAPRHDGKALSSRVSSLAPSWVLSAEGAALLESLHTPTTMIWLKNAHATLDRWGQMQRSVLSTLGWQQSPSVVPFWLARPKEQGPRLKQCLAHLRERGIKLRDATSFGLAGWVRVSVQAPKAQVAIRDAWTSITEETK